MKNNNYAPKKMIVFLASFSTIILLIASCGKSEQQKQKAQKFFWGGPKNISMVPIIADKKGFFKKVNLDIETKYLQTGKIAMDALTSKDIDFGLLVETNMAFIKYQQGSNMEIICYAMKKYDDAIVVRKDKGIKTPKDIEGKSLALLAGTTSHVFAERFIKFYNLDRDKITIVNLTPPSIQAAIINGNISAGSIWEPYRYNIIKALGDKTIEFNDKSIYKAYSIVVVRKEFAQNSPDILKKFVRALIMAEEFIKSNKDESIQILSKELKIDPETLKSIWGEYDIEVGLESDLLQTIKDEGEWINKTQKGFKNLPIPSYNDVINSDILSSVDQNRVKM